MSHKPIIKCEGLCYTYPPNIHALRNINLEIYPNELIAFIGQNGGGKTTLAKHFNGLLKPTKGRVLVKGKDTAGVPPNKLAPIVGYVFQNPRHQIFSSSVYEETAYGPKNLGLSDKEIDKRVSYALAKTGLLEYKDKHPYDLDYGKMKLLTTASIMALKPEVYCLDEPTTGQDHVGRRMLAKLISELNEQGATIIFITHDMKFVAKVAKKTILIADGQIIADGSTRKIFQKLGVLKRAKIEPPQITRLAYGLSSYGIAKDVLTLEEMNQELARTLL